MRFGHFPVVAMGLSILAVPSVWMFIGGDPIAIGSACLCPS
jgi:hypothetical protein